MNATSEKARWKLGVGIERFVYRYPLFGAILSSWLPKEDPSIATMGVGFDAGQTHIILYYSASFVIRIPEDELQGVLLHEVRHIVYGHVFQDSRIFTDHHALVIAQEVTVNERMPEKLPAGVVTLDQYPHLPEDETTEERYQRLAGNPSDVCDQQGGGIKDDDAEESNKRQTGKSRGERGDSESEATTASTEECGADRSRSQKNDSPSKPDKSPEDGGVEGQRKREQRSSPGGTHDQDKDASSSHPKDSAQKGRRETGNASGGASEKDADSSDELSDGANARGKRQERGSRGQGAEQQSDNPPETLDDHSRWGEISGHETLVANDILNSIRSARGSPYLTACERGFLNDFDNNAKTSWVECHLPTGGKRRINWARVLQLGLGPELHRVTSYLKPPRRFPHLVGVVPGWRYKPSKPTVMCVLDTANLSDEQLTVATEELKYIARYASHTWIVEADNSIGLMFKYIPADLESFDLKKELSDAPLNGISHRFALEPGFQKEVKPELVVYFTLGTEHVDLPKPAAPLIWILPVGGKRPACWGKCVTMDYES